MVYFSLTAKLEWLTLVRSAATARAHSRSRNAFGEKTLTSCLTRVGDPEINRCRNPEEMSSSAKTGLARIRQQEYAAMVGGAVSSLCYGLGFPSAKKTVW